MRRPFGCVVLAVLVIPAAAYSDGSDPRIVGGQVAPAGAYPWMATLVNPQDSPSAGHFCGGTLIAPDTVLTAGHCVIGLTPRDFNVVVGHEDLADPGIEKLEVAGYAGHSGGFDVAQVRLAEPVSLTPVPLAAPEDAPLFAPGRSATTLGWGARNENGLSPGDDLREVEVPIVSDHDCGEAYRDDAFFSERANICAGAAGRDSCSGDSGGPLIVADPSGVPKQVGVTSFGKGCGRARFPGVYAEVPAAIAFITDPDPVFAPVPERNAARIKVPGVAKVGKRMRCAAGRWTGEDIEFHYHWFAGFAPRPASKKRHFTPGPELAGKRAICTVIGVNDGGIVELVSYGVGIHGKSQ